MSELVDEIPMPVYFDDLLLKISKERGMQENHYDPWGLNLVGIESEPVDRLERKQYNGKERVSEFGLNWNDHGARFADPQIGGRWMSVDPLATRYVSLSPYAFGANNPIRFFDPDGRKIVDGRFGRVSIDENGQGVYKGKDKSTQDYVAAMNLTQAGRATLKEMVESISKIRVKILDRQGPVDEKKREVQGLTGPTTFARTLVDPKTGEVVYSRTKTVLYEGSFKAQKDPQNVRAGSENAYKDASRNEWINGVGIHEANHALHDAQTRETIENNETYESMDANKKKDVMDSALEVLPNLQENKAREEWHLLYP